MGQGRPGHSMRSRAGASEGETAVTPVIGAVLILAITVMGVAGVLFWGAPMIERIQAQNAQTAVVGELEDLRASSRDLSVPDHSRFPTIVVPRGELSIEPGSRIMVTAHRDGASNPNCNFHVTYWADTSSATERRQFSAAAPNCRGSAVVQAFKVTGPTLVPRTLATGTTSSLCPASCYALPSGDDIGREDWLIRLTHASCPSQICAEAWILSGDQVSWAMDSGAGRFEAAYDSGAIFTTAQGTQFLEREPIIGDATFGTNYYGLWLRSLNASSYGSFSGSGSHQVYLSLLGNYDRTDSSAVSRLRLDVSGDFAEAWCNALLQRNRHLPDGADAGDTPDSIYQSSITGCGAVSTDGVRSVCYAMVTSNPCTSVGSSFTFRFLHARIYTSLVI